jgi:hypothetical protein
VATSIAYLAALIEQFEPSIGTSILLICTSVSFSFFACAASDALVVKVYYIPKEIIKMCNYNHDLQSNSRLICQRFKIQNNYTQMQPSLMIYSSPLT